MADEDFLRGRKPATPVDNIVIQLRAIIKLVTEHPSHTGGYANSAQHCESCAEIMETINDLRERQMDTARTINKMDTARTINRHQHKMA